MPDSRDIRSGKDLKLKAVFVPQGAEGQAFTHNTAISLGPNTLRLPAVFVPEGSSPPGYPYVHFGKMTFDQDADDHAGQTTLPGPKASGPTEQARRGLQPSPPGMANGADSRPVTASPADRGSRSAGNMEARSSAPMGPVLNDQYTHPDDGAGRAASLAFGYLDPTSSASASRYGRIGSPSQQTAGQDDQALRSPDPSRGAIEAALRALAVPPSSGELSQAADRETLANLPPE